MKRAIIFIVLLLIVAPIGAFAMSVCIGVVHGLLGLDFSANETWLRSLGYSYGILGGYALWGDR